jgi:ketosteroid isomerase-like protein
MNYARHFVTGVFPILFLFGCISVTDTEEEKVKLLQTDREFARKSLEVGAAEAFKMFLAEDAIQLPAGSNPRFGRDTIYQAMKAAGEGYTLAWKPQHGEVAASGDFGYTWGNFTLSWEDSSGARQVHYGKYLNVWKKQDGRWRVEVDMGNESPGPESGQD